MKKIILLLGIILNTIGNSQDIENMHMLEYTWQLFVMGFYDLHVMAVSHLVFTAKPDLEKESEKLAKKLYDYVKNYDFHKYTHIQEQDLIKNFQLMLLYKTAFMAKLLDDSNVSDKIDNSSELNKFLLHQRNMTELCFTLPYK